MNPDREQILALQERKLADLVEHCRRFSPDFARRLAACPDGELPLLTRRDLQTARDIHCTRVPADHGAISEQRTSGSTGEPVRVCKTEHVGQVWASMTRRFHDWHRTDFSQTMLSVKVLFKKIERAPNWGPPATSFTRTGPAVGMPAASDASEIWKVARDERVGDLVIFPTNLKALLRLMKRDGLTLPDLRRVRTVSETVSDELRAECSAVLGLDLIDLYSSNEMGNIAIQCPQSGLYHTLDDVVRVEVLRDDGTPCAPGEIGRVVVTDLHNYATPLIRYVCGDYAEVAEPCPCGLPLATLRRIMGRERNLALRPDGRRVWPNFGLYSLSQDVAPVHQYQVVQHSLDDVEVKLAVERELTDEELSTLTGLVETNLGFPIKVRFTFFADRIPVPPSGKYEEFVSHA